MKRPLSALLVLALVLGTPGLPAWQALAATGKAATQTGTGSNVPGQSGAQSGVGTAAGPAALGIAPVSLNGSLALTPGAPALSLTPSVAAGLAPETARAPAAVAAAPLGAVSAAVPSRLLPVLPAPNDAPAPGETPGAKAGLEAAAKKVADPKADATAALNATFEGSKRGKDDSAVAAKPGRWRALLGRSAPAAAPAVAPAAVPGAAVAEARPGRWQRFKDLVMLREFSKSERSYLIGQALFLTAISVYLATLPLMVHALTGDTALLGQARAVHYWSFAAASLFAGRLNRVLPLKTALVGTSVARALIFGAIGVLTIGSGLNFVGFLFLAGASAVVASLSHLNDTDAGGPAKVFSSNEKIARANYMYGFVKYSLLLGIPTLMGWVMQHLLIPAVGEAATAGAGYVLFAGLMLLAAYVYGKDVKQVGTQVVGPALREMLQGALTAALGSWRHAASYARSAFGAVARPVASFRSLLASLAPVLEVFRFMRARPAVKTRAGLTVIEQFAEDALFNVVLPTYAFTQLGMGVFGAGLMTSLIYAGGLVASTFLVGLMKQSEARYGVYGMVKILSFVAALAFIPTLGFWGAPSIWLAFPAAFFLKLMLQPMNSRMSALLQVELNKDAESRRHSDGVWSVITVLEVLAAGAGAVAFSWLLGSGLTVAGFPIAMVAVTGLMLVLGILYAFTPRALKDSLTKPVLSVHQSPEGNEEKMLKQLAQSLQENGLPPFVESKSDEPADDGRPTVVILAPASRHKIAIAREGARQSPGDVHLVLDASWLTQETYPDGRTKLLVRKAVVFDRGGQARVVEYADSRRVRYFANYFTTGANGRDDGHVFEKNLDVPQSNSLQLETEVNDKLMTRLLMAARGVAVPLTLALAMPSHILNANASAQASGGFTVAAMPAEVARLVGEYLDRYEGQEVVVKPSGPAFHSGYGVKFFGKDDRAAIIAHAVALSRDSHMTDDGAVLVDSRVDSAPLRTKDGRKAETTLRVLAARTPWDGFATTGVFARVGPWGKPTTAEAADPRDNATVEPWADLLAEWKAAGLLDERSARELDAEVRALGPAAFDAIAAHEKGRARKDGEPYQAQTDLIGLDVMIERRVDAEGRVKLVPIVIEVNDHDSGGQYNLDLAHRGTDKVGEHSREWMATALQRARRDALKGQRIVMVGAGYSGKRFIFEKAKKLGVEVVLVDKRTPFVDELIRDGLVSELIETDNSKPKEALASAKKKLLRSIRRNGALGGITSFWEDDLPLTADLAKEFGLPYHTQAAAAAVRSKDETLRILEEGGIQETKRRLIVNDIDAKGEDLKRIERDFLKALDEVGVPAVLKPAGGAAAIGTKKITNRAEALAVLAEVRSMARPEVDDIFKFPQNRNLSLGEYFDGPEWDADIVMRDGRPLFVSLTDNWPTREPYFLATGSTLPSRRLSAKQQAEVETLVINAAKALGLNNGVIHLEGKYTSKGARLIEANGRMGGEYVHDWVEAVWGVSLVEEGLLAAAGVKGRPFKAPQPLLYLEGGFVIPENSGVIEAFGLPADAREQPGFHELRVKKQIGDRIAVPPAGYERAGMLVARGVTADEAKRNLDRLNAALLLQVK